jgi:signal transduction histidine kinase/ligand-binding sensor domain-containing protein
VWAGITDWNKAHRDRIVFLHRGETHFRTLFEVVTDSVSGGNLVHLAESPDGRIWLSTVSSVRILKDDTSGPYFVDRTISVLADKVRFDRDGNMWLSWYGKGLAKLEPATLNRTNSLVSNEDIRDRFTRQDQFSADYVHSIFEDREGNIWTGTTGGLDCFAEMKVTALSHREGIPYDANLSIQATPDGNIWAFSTLEGLEKIDLQHRQFTGKGWSPFALAGLSSAFCLYADNGGRVFAGTSRGLGLIQKDEMSQFPLPGGQDLRTVIAITQDRAGGLWLCDHDKGVFRLLEDKLEKVPELNRTTIEYAITAHGDQVGRVWFGYAYGGIVCYNQGQIQRFSSREGLFSGQVRTVFTDDKGRVWAAGDGGLSQFENGRFITLTRENGLADDDIYAILEDDDEFFWIAGVHGLFRAPIAQLEEACQGRIRAVHGELFEVQDGVRGVVHHAATATQGLCYSVATKAPDGKLWFSTSAGLTVVDPRHIPKNQVPPAIHIEQVIAAGKTNRALGPLRFPVGTKDCELDYVGLTFADPSRVRYEYKLDGYDQDWVKAGARRQAFYSNLGPKSYRFRVRARNNDAVWNESGAIAEFSIAPAVYETAWFPAVCLAACVAGLFGMYRLRLRRVASRMELQLAAEQNERKRIAQELHDTLLQGFTGVGLKLDALTNSLPASLDATKKQFQKTLEQIDQYLTEGRRSVWKLRSPTLERAEDFPKALEKASRRALEGTAIPLSLSVQGQPRKLKEFFEDNLLRICEETVANSVKHGRPTQIEVTLLFNCKDVQLRVQDNGCGFDTKHRENSKQGHFGLVGIQERVQSMRGRFYLESRPDAGTDIVVTIPAK